MRQVFILLLCAVGAYATPSGATKNSCSSMLPEHPGVQVQNSRAPYTVSAVRSGNKVRVTISSPVGEEIGGFMLQARTRDGSRLVEGKFSSSQNTKTIDCFQGQMNTLTHTSAGPKKEIQTEWTPTGPINEDIIFRATVAKIYALYWDRIDSDRIRIQSVGGSSNTDRSSSERMAESSVSMYEGCYVTKGCFAQPANCISQGDCEILLSFSKISSGIRFSLAGYLEERMYMAMGLSTDGRMGDDAVTECYREGSNVIARQSYNNNEGKSNSRTTPLPRDRYSGSYTNGLTTCTWTSPFVTQMFGRTYDLDNNTYYALLAKGPMENGRLGYHTSRTPSSERVNFTALEGVEDAGTTDAVKVHGAFMVTAWVFFVSLGIILPKAFKNVWEQSSLCGQRIWFALHRAFMIVSLVLIVIAFIVIFVHKNGWNYVTKNPHAILGCTAVALGLFQPIMAAFRPSPDHKNRPIFNWLHWTVGNSAHILAIITIFFAVSLESSGLKDDFYWVMAIYVIVHVIFHFMFQLHMFTSQKKKNNDLSMNEMNSGRTGVIENIQAKNITENVFKILLLGIYGIFLLVILLTLYALIAVA